MKKKSGPKRGEYLKDDIADLTELDEFFRDELESESDSDEDDFDDEKEIIKSYSKIEMPFVRAAKKPFNI